MKTKTYQVNEIFHSVQGEGVLSGMPATFVRLQGCTVGCEWCDTKYTWAKGGTRMSCGDILKEAQLGSGNVVITGGEPTLYDLDPLLKVLVGGGINHVQLETSGQQALKGRVKPSWVTWSPKKNLDFEAPFEFKKMVDEVKWVVDQHFYDECWSMVVAQYLQFRTALNKEPYFVFMPEGCPPDNLSMAKALYFVENKPKGINPGKWRFSDRIQYRLGVR